MKKVLFGLTILLSLFLTSCETGNKDGLTDETSSVVLKFSNPMLEADGAVAKSDGNKYDLPECADETAYSVDLTINGHTYTSLVSTLFNGEHETSEIKLPAGLHILSALVVRSQSGQAIWAAPRVGSYIANAFGLVGLDFEFSTKAFEKKLINVDVLCYEPAYYDSFGFNWFTFTEKEVKEVCFYVNLCRENFEDWHIEGSPYFNQEYDGRYFSGIIEVVIKGDGWSNTHSNIEWQGNGRPLCVEYIDVEHKEDIYIYEVYLLLPDGSKILIQSDTFTDENASGFGGADGVWDIRIACEGSEPNCDCSYDCSPDVIDGDREKVKLCHKVQIGNDWKFVTLTVPASAVEAHLAHGDELGACE